MKITLHEDSAGKLMIYVLKKDLEEEVVAQVRQDNVHIFTLSNGWELSVPDLEVPFKTPKTVRAQRL
jgi:nitrogen fixation protein NifT